MERTVQTFLWNGMDERGYRAHTMVVRDGKITENNIYESTGSESDYHGERYVPEFQKAAPNVVVYMDKTPCTECVEYLIDQYKDTSKLEKPTIYASYFFSYKDNEYSKKQSQQALEKLHLAGFKICPVDINEFLQYFDEDYQHLIKDVANTGRFKKGQEQLQEYLKNTCS